MPRLRCYDYVDQPYARVFDALRKDAPAIFRRATASAVDRRNALGAQLRVQAGPIDLATDISIELGPPRSFLLEEVEPATDFPISWHARVRPGLFPRMQAQLRVFAVSETESQLELQGTYQPPLGVLGDAVDALIGHRIAEATVHNFVSDVAAQLRRELTG